MSDPDYETRPAGGSARDQLGAHEDEHLEQISTSRRRSRTIAPPRKWRRSGLSDIVCPECRAKIPGIPDGFWHLQTAHNQGKGVDLEAWGSELRDELDEFMAASRGRRGLMNGTGAGEVGLMGCLVLLAVVALLGVGLVYFVVNGG